jgi:RNA-directed DNA polymerase
MYCIHRIRKSNNTFRYIEEPSPKLKLLQKDILKEIRSKVSYLGLVHGVSGTSIVTNSGPHVGSRYICNIDLKDFFYQITSDRIQRAFQDHGLNIDAGLVTYKGRLPMGAPTSPDIASLVFMPVDKKISEYIDSLDKKISYTRYVDDITLSGPGLNRAAIRKIVNIIKDNNYLVNHRKTKITSSNRLQTVTGITVNKKPNVSKKARHLFRAVLDKFARENKKLTPKEHGTLAFYNQVDPSLSKKFIDYFNNRLNKYGHLK